MKNLTKQQSIHRPVHGKRWIQDGSGCATSAQGWVKNLDESTSMNLIVAQEMFEKKLDVHICLHFQQNSLTGN